jgi:hypothetical protein
MKLLHAQRLPSLKADELIEDYRRLLELTNPELVPDPNERAVHSSRHLVRHVADVPVLLSAMASHNTKHFTQTVATACRTADRNASGFLPDARFVVGLICLLRPN